MRNLQHACTINAPAGRRRVRSFWTSSRAMLYGASPDRAPAEGSPMKLLSMVFAAAAVLLTATDGAQAYYRWPFYDAAYIGGRLHLGYRGRPYSMGAPA